MVWWEGYFDILDRLGVDHECVRQTDGRTDMLIANAALNYVARQKKLLTRTNDVS